MTLATSSREVHDDQLKQKAGDFDRVFEKKVSEKNLHLNPLNPLSPHT